MKPILLLAMIATLAGCARPGDHPISSNCRWIEDNNRKLNLENAADRRHLRFDSVTAEDVAIRWADKYFGHTPEYGERRDECMGSLFNDVASHHGVDVTTVQQYSLERDFVLDPAVFLGFGALYAVIAYYFAGRIRRRFPREEPGFWIMTFTMSVGVALVGLLIGILGAIVIETLSLNSGHLSYRMDRIPWRQHWVVLFVCGFVIFGLAAVIRARVGIKDTISTASR